MKKLFAFGCLFFVFTFTLCAQETITLTTYYPSPFGIYNRMVTNTLGVGDNNGSGVIDAGDAPDPTVAGQAGDVWIAGDVGIGTGTAGPNGDLHIVGDNGQGGNGNAEIILEAWNTENDSSAGQWEIAAPGGAPADDNFGDLTFTNTNPSGTSTTPFTIEDGAGNNSLYIDEDGNVGIGTDDPQAKLDVNGGVKISGDSGACGSTNAGVLRYQGGNVEVCDGSGWKNVSSRPEMITCSKLGASPTLHISGNYYYSFVAADCGGTLPNTNYKGAIRTVEACNGIEHWQLLDPGDTYGPGVWWYPDGSLCTWAGGNKFRVSALYIKYQ